MRNLFRFGVPPVLAAVILVFALTGTFHAQPAGPNGKAADQAALNQKIRDALFRVLQEGVALHNQKRDYAGCYRVYQGALLSVQPLLDHRPDLQRAISEGLQAAESAPPPAGGGFTLRKVIDDVRAGLKTAAPPTDKKDKEPPPTDKDVPAKKDKKDDGVAKKDEKKDEPPMRFDIKVPTNAELAGNLKGRLLLVHGDMDNNVHPAGTIRLVDALIKANKRFDMLILPGKAHGFANYQPYFNQRMWEYFAEYLLDDRPAGVDLYEHGERR